MALVDPNIAMSYRGIEVPNQLAQYGQLVQIQNAQNQNSLAQYQLGAAQRAEAKDVARSNALSKAGTDDTAIANALLQSGDLKGYSDFLKTRRETQKADVDLIDAKLKQSRSFLDTIDPSDPNAPNMYIAWHESNHKDPVLGPVLAARGVTADQSRQRIMDAVQNGPAAFATLLNQSKLGSEKFIEFNKPQLSTKDTGGELVDRTFEPLTGKITPLGTTTKTMAPGEAERLKNDAVRIKQEGQRIGLEGRRVAVAEENNRREADPAFQQRMGGARAVGEAIAKGDVAAMQALPKVIGRAEEGIRLIDELVGKRDSKTGQLLKGEKTHPGFQNAVGATWLPGARFVPGTDAAGFMSRFDQIKGASFLEAFESLKGGGAITEKEGQKGTDAINRMSTSTDEKEFIRAAMDLQDVIRKGVSNAQSRASRAGGTAPTSPAAPASGGVIDFGSLK